MSAGISQLLYGMFFPLFVISVPHWHLVESEGKKTNDMLNLTVLTVNITCDFLGRVIAAFKIVQKINIKVVIVICYLRIGLAIIFVLFNFPQFEETTKPILCSDWLFYVSLVLFSLSMAYIQTCGFMRYQEFLETEEEKTRGSYIMNLFMQSGLFIGALSTMGLISMFK